MAIRHINILAALTRKAPHAVDRVKNELKLRSDLYYNADHKAWGVDKKYLAAPTFEFTQTEFEPAKFDSNTTQLLSLAHKYDTDYDTARANAATIPDEMSQPFTDAAAIRYDIDYVLTPQLVLAENTHKDADLLPQANKERLEQTIQTTINRIQDRENDYAQELERCEGAVTGIGTIRVSAQERKAADAARDYPSMRIEGIDKARGIKLGKTLGQKIGGFFHG